MGPASVGILWAVHLSDGVLSPPWLAGGFLAAGLLALAAAYRMRDEEIPRIALLSAAFFIASLMHLPLGPTSVHLLLNGLVGVVLGRRAPLAILVGLGLQAVLLGHGGFWALGVNACVLSLPALLAGGTFAVVRRLPGVRAGHTALLWVIGCGIGMASVFATLILQAAVLLWGAAEDWHQIVWLLFSAHLPVVLVEGVVLGFTMSFLARVKPEMLGLPGGAEQNDPTRGPSSEVHFLRPELSDATTPTPSAPDAVRPPLPSRPPALLLVALTSLFAIGPAHAHRLDAAFSVLPDRQVLIDSWFDLGGVPKGAKVQVFRPEGQLLAEGQLDEVGHFVFRYAEEEDLKVVVSAGAGHRKEFVIRREDLQPSSSTPGADDQPAARPGRNLIQDAGRQRGKDVLLGVTFLLALAAFILSWRNGRRLRSMSDNPTKGA